VADLTAGAPAATVGAAGEIASRLRDEDGAGAPTVEQVLGHAVWWRAVDTLLERVAPELDPDARAGVVDTVCRRNRVLGTAPDRLLNPPGGPGDLAGKPGDPLLPAALASRRPAPDAATLDELLAVPLGAGDVVDQLRLLADRWRPWLGPLGDQIATSAALLRERHQPRDGGPGPAPVPVFGDGPAGGGEPLPAFSPDADWMPAVVLIAKNTLVWLEQLSRRCDRPIRTLDAIPDAVLDELAGWGVTGLWLIGVWQRSAASARIKELCGMGDQGASAYAVADYRVADELGGEQALADLARRARERGIRLAGDMVPNHMGIDSAWVLEHPDRFLWLPQPPFPSYRYTGPDLSPVPWLSLRIEDHYYDRSDAAVTFQRIDHRTGEVRYVYHGNDGTSTPWNDTAQIDLLDPEAREALIGTILAVARRFPIIRFDAAMVLVRRHVQRLWHPLPGEPGGVPGRGAFPMGQAEFDAALPREFWREVVDRIAAEAPGTLLLAEAFWLLEDYFVRHLGMHRVYNSAFMHMLRDEDNASLRRLLENVLAHDPRILERFVNFLTNPDEETAVAQFGKGDKYFGACALLATLPGLPLLGHGQCEGLEEKYGMEFRRPWRDERPDTGFLAWHERMVFPLLRERRRYAGSATFGLLAATAPDGTDEPDVLAYVVGAPPALVVFNNTARERAARLRETVRQRWLRDGEPGPLARRSLAELLAAPADGEVRLRDSRSGFAVTVTAETLRQEGLTLALPPYGCHVFDEIAPV